MPRRSFTDEELNEIANKEWKQTPIFTSDEKVAYKAKNLTGPKTPEGKKRALQNLRVGKNKGESSPMSHGGYIMRLLDQEEQEMYEQFKKEFLDEFDINESSDGTILELVLIDKVRLYRVMKAQFQNPSMDIDRPLTEITNRLNKNLESLGTLRKQRLKQDEKLTAISIGTISKEFWRQMLDGDLQQEQDEMEEEERLFLEKKQQRERERGSNTIDAEYEVVDDGNGEE